MPDCWNEATTEQHKQLTTYRNLVLDSNRKFNLTALRDTDSIDNRLIGESLRLLPFLPSGEHLRAVDIGTGAGIPGIPLAIVRPDVGFTLIEATGKKARFLELVVTELGLTNVTPLHDRAEIVARDPVYREHADIVVARAVTQLAALAELSLPFLRIGGRALLPKGEKLDDELDRARMAIEIVGGFLVSADLLPPVAGCGVTRLVILDKIERSLVRYPRRPGTPEHDPLGS